ncbi:MAG TPA: LamG domain-containing protein, partial [Pilimelia sp.]|nr:LamG domain-containing protein [Pilimelia sp.]
MVAIEWRRAREPSYRGVRRRPVLFAAGRHRARRGGPRTHRPTRRMIMAAVLAGVVVPLSYAAFGHTAGTPGNVFAAAATFPTYPDAVGADGPLFQHRGEEAQSAAAAPAAADSSGNNRPGVYQGRTDGPATWWRFDEGSGGTVADASGAANPGTLTGANVGWAAGPAGGALSVTTGTGYVQATAPVRTDDSFSIAAWVNLAATGANRTAVSQRGANTSAFALRYHSSGRWAFAAARTDVSSPTVDQVTSTVAATPATWVHLVGVYDDPADQLRLYVDGARQGAGTAKTAEWHAGANLLAGRAWLAGALAEQWLGQLDDVRVFRRALDDAEAAAVYHTPVTAWEFEENSGASVADSSHHNNPGTFTGTSYWTASGYSGNAGLFSGDDHVTGAAAGVRTDESFTVAAWVYLTDATAARAAVSLPGTTSSGFVLKHQSNRWELRLPQSDVAAPTSDTAVSTTAAATNTWVHLAGVYDDRADEVRLYVNGVLEGTATHTTEWAAGGVLTAGRSWWAGAAAEPWIGRLDRIRLYHHALGTADGSGRGNTGTLSGATWTTGPDDSPAVSFDGSAGVSGTGPAVDT